MISYLLILIPFLGVLLSGAKEETGFFFLAALIFLIGLVKWVEIYRTRTIILPTTSLNLPIIGLVCWIIFLVLISDNKYRAIVNLNFTVTYLLYFLLLHQLDLTKNYRILILFLLGLIFIVLTQSILILLPKLRNLTPSYFFSNPNHVASLLACGFLTVIFLFFRVKGTVLLKLLHQVDRDEVRFVHPFGRIFIRTGRNFNKSPFQLPLIKGGWGICFNWGYQLLLFTLLIIFGTAIYYTQSRSIIIGLLCSISYLIWYKLRIRGIVWYLFFILMIFIFIPNTVWQDKFKLSSSDPYAVNYRQDIWITALSAFMEKPVAGIGPGGFAAAYLRYNRPVPINFNTGSFTRYGKSTEFVHNEFLQFTLEQGIPALVLICWLIGIFFREINSRKLVASSISPSNIGGDVVGEILFCRTIIITILIQSIFDFPLHLPALCLILITIISLITGKISANKKYDVLLYNNLNSTLKGLNYNIVGRIRLLGYIYTCSVRVCSQLFFFIIPLIYLIFNLLAGLSVYFNHYKMPELSLKLMPVNYEYWAAVGYNKISHQPQQALRYLTRASELYPQDSFVSHTLGNLYLQFNYHRKAVYYYHRAILLNPHYPFFYLSLGDWYFYQKEYTQAVNYYTQAVKLEPLYLAARIRLVQTAGLLKQEHPAQRQMYFIRYVNEKLKFIRPKTEYEKLVLTPRGR